MPDLHLSRGRLVLSRGGYLLYGTSACVWHELAHFGAFVVPGIFVTMLGTVIDILLHTISLTDIGILPFWEKFETAVNPV